MTDPQARPTDRERSDLTARIQAAADAGRISTADRDIRLQNVSSAQSRTELDLMSRDLDQLEAAGLAGARTSGTVGRFSPALLVGVVAAVAVVLGGLLAVIVLLGHHGSDSSRSTALPPAQTDNAAPTDADDPSGGSSAKPITPSDYALDARGINGFLATYAKKFGTTRVVQLVLYRDYAVVDVPVAGAKGRQSGWIYRKDSGWTTFGGVQAVFPGAGTIDTRQLAIAPLLRNIARARTSLKVETPTQTYVVLRFIPQADPLPGVDIHVANGFNESGYLATRLDGTVVRAYPYR